MFQKCIEGTDHLAWPSGLMQANGDTARRSRRRNRCVRLRGEKTSELARARARGFKSHYFYILLTFFAAVYASRRRLLVWKVANFQYDRSRDKVDKLQGFYNSKCAALEYTIVADLALCQGYTMGGKCRRWALENDKTDENRSSSLLLFSKEI